MGKIFTKQWDNLGVDSDTIVKYIWEIGIVMKAGIIKGFKDPFSFYSGWLVIIAVKATGTIW